MPTWIAVVLLGVVEGITEFLPVSSTGHLLIAEKWLGLHCSDLFNVVIQCGAVLAVLPLFRDRLQDFVFRWRERPTQEYAAKLALAFVLTAAGGLALDATGFKLPDDVGPVAGALFLGGIGFVLVEAYLSNRQLTSVVTWSAAIAVGAAQLLAAAFPGTSRSGATILIALLLGLTRVAATEFTFLVGIPTMLAAGSLKIAKELSRPAESQTEEWSMVALGFVVSAVVSFLAVKWLLRYIQTHSFKVFGWYRIGLAGLIWLLYVVA